MSYETEIEKHKILAFTAATEHLAQQMGSKVRRLVSEDPDNVRGEGAAAVRQYGLTEAEEAVDLHGDTPIMSTPRDNRWAFPRRIHWGDLLDWKEVQEQITDPASDLTRAGAMAMGRALDRKVLLPAFFGTARSGKQGEVSTPFPASSQDVGTNVGGTGSNLNVEKIMAGMELFGLNEVDTEMEEVHMLIGPRQARSLMRDTQYISKDFVNQAVLPDGRLRPLHNVNFTVINGLNIAGGVRDCILFTKSAIRLKRWTDMTTFIMPRADKQMNPQIYQKQAFGAVRTQEVKVVRVKCTDTATFDGT